MDRRLHRMFVMRCMMGGLFLIPLGLPGGRVCCETTTPPKRGEEVRLASIVAQSQMNGKWFADQAQSAIRKCIAADADLQTAIGRGLEDAQPFFELLEAIELYSVREFAPQRAEQLVQTLVKDEEPGSFSDTWRTWCSLAQQGSMSLRAETKGTVVRIRMVDMDVQLAPLESTNTNSINKWSMVFAHEFGSSDIETALEPLEERYLDSEGTPPADDNIPVQRDVGKTTGGSIEDHSCYLCGRLRLASTQQQNGHNGMKSIARVWLVYEVSTPLHVGQPEKGEVVERVAVRDCRLVYVSGAWCLDPARACR